MATRRAQPWIFHRTIGLVAILAILAATAGWVVTRESGLGAEGSRKPGIIGSDRLISWEPLPAMEGPLCQWAPANASARLVAALEQRSGSGESALPPAGTRPSEQARTEVAKRQPIRVIGDPNSAFAGIAVDPVRNEVVMGDENLNKILVYDRLENTPPTARMSEPKRMIGGQQTFLEFACSVYVDPINGDIYAINNDTMNWLPVFNRDAKGDVPPLRKLATPHTTFGIVADEQEQELFLTIQDDHAVVVYKKTAQEQDRILRILQGRRTQLADPHGIALDPKTGLIYVSNWGTNNDRPALGSVPGGGSFGRGAERTDWPVGRTQNFPASGKIQPPSVTVYRKDAQADTPPLRMIQGPKTQLNWPTALAVHPDRGELFVTNDTGHSVVVFRTEASGDVAPLRVLKGPRTMIQNPTGVAIDLKNNELWVANFGSHSATVFKIDAEGDAKPLRVIRSGPPDVPSPMIGNPHTIAFDTKREEILVSN